MDLRTLRILSCAVAALVLASLAGAQTSTQVTVEAGVQVVKVDGNEDMYRSQINESDGLVLQRLSFSMFDTSGKATVLDRFRLEASGFGGRPAGRLRLEAGLARAYTLSLGYTRADHFSALPTLANPFFDEGIVPGQHTLNRTRETLDLNLQILPGRMITPMVAYRWSRLEGPGRTTIHVGQDEFQLNQRLKDTAQEFQVGAAFNVAGFHGVVLQGWRDYRITDHSELVFGAGSGNLTRPIVGYDVRLSDYNRTSTTKGTIPFTTAYLTGRVTPRVRLVGSYTRADLEADLRESESAIGTLVSFELRRAFEQLQAGARGNASLPDWRGELRLEASLTDQLILDVGVRQRSRELDGWAVLSQMFRNAVTFAGTDKTDISRMLRADTAMKREEDTLDARLTLRDVGPFRFWAGWSATDQRLTITPDALQVIVPGGQGGTFDRTVDRISAGAALTLGTLQASVDYRKDDGDRAVVRTDFLDQERVRFRATWAPLDILRLGVSRENLDAKNPTLTTELDLCSRSTTADLELGPLSNLTVRAAYGKYTADSTIVIRRPQDFVLEPSLYAEKGTMWDGGVTYQAGRVLIEGGYSTFENTGSLAFELKRALLRLEVPLSVDVTGVAMFDTTDYLETALNLADFKAKRYGIALRWRQ